MMQRTKQYFLNLSFICICLLVVIGYGCSSTHSIVRPELTHAVDSVNFDSIAQPPEDWHQLDQEFRRFPGISSELAYKYALKNRKPRKRVIVAVVDGGVDINSKDLKDHIWTNKDEVPDNDKDDDHNGYVDDVHGWNFIGGPKGNVNNDTFEAVRIYARLKPTFEHADTTTFTAAEQKKYELYKKVKNDYEYQVNKLLREYDNVTSMEQSMQRADSILTDHFNGSYNNDDVQKLQPQSRPLAFAQHVMSYVMKSDIDSAAIADQKKHIYQNAKYGYNPDFTTRNIVGDDYDNKEQHIYGNNQVDAAGPLHGTHVSGIIAADRHNGIGIDGIANDVRIMPVRVVPDGDERDKDVANGIRYAVDNGADIINMSFGKSYSPYKNVVDEAVKYADEHGVLMIHAAGNSSQDTDEETTYPTDRYGDDLQGGKADAWISVGASSWHPDKKFVAEFSNYGQRTVDLFAPGVDIYSTVLQNHYKRESGTSMATPVVSGVSALIMEYFPKLSAVQVKQVLMQSVKTFPGKSVEMPGDSTKTVPFDQLSITGGEVNVFNALQAAQGLMKN